MKKLMLLLLLLFIPLNVFAYSDYIYPGGETLGVEVNTNGIMIIGFYKINGKFNKGTPELKNGDYIIKINNIEVNTTKELTDVIENAEDKRSIKVEYIRNGKKNNTELQLIKDDGKYKTGLFVKASIKGIGTLSYVDPETKVYGALGHEINFESSLVEIKEGYIFENTITNIDKSKEGYAGSKIASFNSVNRYGNILKNTKYGIFGIYDKPINLNELLYISKDIKVGKAYIRTVLDGQNIENYEIEIISIDENNSTKNIVVNIVDDKLIEKTGGIVQGMSGSPIIQNDKIVGVLTHVVVDNPIKGYGILITKMLEEGDKLL